jgi:hypothetical protein
MSGALRRTPSPQQFFDSTGKTVAAGVAAAGAAVGKALASIREEERPFADNNPWSEEADARKDRATPGGGRKRKTVAIVVSADSHVAALEDEGFHEHAVSALQPIGEKQTNHHNSLFFPTSHVTMTSPRSSSLS